MLKMHIVLISATKFEPLEKSGWNKGLASTCNLCFTPRSPVLLLFFLFLYRVSTCNMCYDCLRRKYSEEYLDLLEREREREREQ